MYINLELTDIFARALLTMTARLKKNSTLSILSTQHLHDIEKYHYQLCRHITTYAYTRLKKIIKICESIQLIEIKKIHQNI